MDYTKRENNRVEVWKDIRDYEGLYQVSNWSRVRSLDRYVNANNGSLQFKQGKILKTRQTWDGYLIVDLHKAGRIKTVKVHRLVAEAFIPNPDNLPQVNHKDENKQNNVVTNLEWCTNDYNYHYGTCIERKAKSKQIPIKQYTLDGEFVREWESAIQAEREGSFMSTTITKCCKGKQKTHKDYIWKYK